MPMIDKDPVPLVNGLKQPTQRLIRIGGHLTGNRREADSAYERLESFSTRQTRSLTATPLPRLSHPFAWFEGEY